MRLNETTIRAIEPPAKGYKLIADDELPGFGLRVTAAGVRTFVLTYQTGGRQRRASIGRWNAWSATAARNRARELRREIDGGFDPLSERERERGEPTVAELIARYVETKTPKQRRGWEYETILRREVLPAWGRHKAANIRRRVKGGARIDHRGGVKVDHSAPRWRIPKGAVEAGRSLREPSDLPSDGRACFA